MDLAPTIAELAGVEPTVPVDGVSLVPLLRTSDRSNLRGAVFAEWVGDETIPGWWELRTARFAYVELGTGERELYALFHDPYELVNVVDDPRFTPDVERLAAALAAQREG